MIDLTKLNPIVLENLQYIILVMTAMILIALIVFIDINRKMTKLNRRYRKMMQGMDEVNLEKMLINHVEEVRDARKTLGQLTERCNRLDEITATCVQKVGIIRFNAFEDTGSDLSFSVALLDSKDNGIVMSSIFSRSESRIYAKPIIKAESSYFLTDEEKMSIKKCKEKNNI